MWRLRTTAALSVLALAVGIAGTGWLSALTGKPRQVVAQPNAAPIHPRAAAAPRPVAANPSRRPPAAVRRVPTVVGVGKTEEVQAASLPAPALVPLAMPDDRSQSWQALRAHLDGDVVLQLRIDGRGQVERARLARSSGDPILDEYALRSVRGWRFAVPADHPDGWEAELPMHFSRAGVSSTERR